MLEADGEVEICAWEWRGSAGMCIDTRNTLHSAIQSSHKHALDNDQQTADNVLTVIC